MNRRLQTDSDPFAAWARRVAHVAAIVVLSLGFATAVVAQQPLPTSPIVPIPMSWPMFHSGGVQAGPVTVGTPAYNPPVNPFYNQLNGTNTELVTDPNTFLPTVPLTPTQIPSFLLGNYNPVLPPGIANTFFPNHFRDGGILSWSSPLLFSNNSTGTTAKVTVDDSTGAPNFVQTNFISNGTLNTTATNQEYLTANVVNATGNATASALWTLTAAQAGQYVITANIPDPTADGTTTNDNVSTDAHYQVFDSAGNVLADTRIDQTATNSQAFISGPFFLGAGATIRVKLYNDTQNGDFTQYVMADSLTLQPGNGVGEESSPTAVNATQYPEIANALYQGPIGNNSSAYTPDTVLFGNSTVSTTQPVKQQPAVSTHEIRQVVYYGRSESIITQNTNPALGNYVPSLANDSVVTVGAIYCVDGLTGSVIWRYQIPFTYQLNTSTNQRVISVNSGAVFSSPVVARINVFVRNALVSGVLTPLYSTKLVVIVGDDNGRVYCLDAVGNRDGTSNTSVIDTTTNQPIYLQQPVYNTTPETKENSLQVNEAGYTPHVGTTQEYWVYRADPNDPLNPPNSSKAGQVKQGDGASDLPVPESFGIASPTVYVDPTKAQDGTTTPLGTAPNANPVPDATVYIGNSNGVLYAFDASDAPDATGTTTNGVTLPVGTTPGTQYHDNYNLVEDIKRLTTDPVVPTPQPLWWWSFRGAVYSSNNTSNADIEGAPAVYFNSTLGKPIVYVACAHEEDANSNIGHMVALDGVLGPWGNGGLIQTPGFPDYNINQRPSKGGVKDANYWAWPDVFGTGLSSNSKPRPALGNMTGSPVVFSYTDSTNTVRTRIYIAANTGLEIPSADATGDISNETRPADDETGRLWSVNLDGSTNWAYPNAWDPNDEADSDFKGEPVDPFGAFLNMTPAVGYVQFPTVINNGDGTAWTHTDDGGDVKSRDIPMLYYGTRGVSDTSFYALDLNVTGVDPKGTTTLDDERGLYDVTSPSGATFQSAPTLVTNPSRAGGNGGDIFVTNGNDLLEIGATPVTNINTSQIFPVVNLDSRFTGAGPISAPAVAGADIHDQTINQLIGDTGDLTTAPYDLTKNNDSDWVYVGDNNLSIVRGITPGNQNGGGSQFLQGILPADLFPPGQVLAQYPLYNYLFDGTTGHENYWRRMDKANPKTDGNPLTTFEWGDRIYVRISNVIPPDALDTTTGQPIDPTLLIPDPDDSTGTVFYGSGGPVTFKIQEDVAQGTRPALQHTNQLQIPATILTQPNGTRGLGNGFYVRDPADGDITGGGAPDVEGNDLPNDTHGDRYIAAYTYRINSSKNETNTPGAQHRVIESTQTATRYVLTTDPNTNATSYVASGTVTLQSVATAGVQYSTVVGGQRVLRQTTASNDPTFSLLNPIALRAGGSALPFIQQNPGQLIGFRGNSAEGLNLGPFRGINSANIPHYAANGTTILPASNGDVAALDALSNGNSVYTTVEPPPSTQADQDPTTGGRRRRQLNTNYPRRTRVLVASTQEINHNTTGDNTDPTFKGTAAPFGSATIDAVGSGLSGGGAVTFGKYTLDVADRSDLGPHRAGRLALTATQAALAWNDNSRDSSGNRYDGPGSVINPLPWDDIPTSARLGTANQSKDYPDINNQAMEQLLTTNPQSQIDQAAAGVASPYLGIPGNMTGTGHLANPDPAFNASGIGSGQIINRTVYADPVQVKIDVPLYQPANIQYFDATAGATHDIAPTDLNINDAIFPMGYVARNQDLFVDSNSNNRRDDDEAYRTITVFTGVPPDLGTSIQNTTTDIGKVPHGFGVQVGSSAILTDAQGNGNFEPYNQSYVSFFKPVTVYNTGNVNLVNIHFDQKINQDANLAAAGLTSLNLLADPLDQNAFIPAFDFANISGTNVNNQSPFLIRTPLDTDLLAQNIGRNIGILTQTSNGGITGAGTQWISLYPGATFHKARVGDANPTILTVPDVPHDNDPVPNGDVATNHNLRTYPFSLPLASIVKIGSYGGATGILLDADPNTSGVNYTGLPATRTPVISVAVPVGTPVGTYSQRLRMFEGIDPSGYAKVYGAGDTGLYKGFLGPLYGGVQAGFATPSTLTDVFAVPGGTALQPYSDPATNVVVKVIESRITDGNTYGSLSPFDVGTQTNQQTGGKGVTDYAPSAYRDLFWNGNGLQGSSGNTNLFWTSSRDYLPGTSVPYDIYGITMPTDGANTLAFLPGTPAGRWWNPFTSALGADGIAFNAQTDGVNSQMSIAPCQQLYNDSSDGFVADRIAYGFFTNVASNPANPAQSYSNSVYCVPLTGAGASFGSAPIQVSNDPSRAKYGVHGLKMPHTFSFPDPLSTAGPTITRDLWAFWYAGTRGRTALYYSSADDNGTIAFQAPAVLPVPAGLVSVADPSAVVTYGPDPNGVAVPVIEVTYTGINATGNADIYVSRYRPYHPRKSDGTEDTTQTLLALVAFGVDQQALSPVAASNEWQARDVAWSRSGYFNVNVNGVPLLRDIPTFGGAPTNLYNVADDRIKVNYDQASGIWVFSGVNLSGVTGGAVNATTAPIETIYADLANGRLRFSPALAAGDSVVATFTAEARRVTTDPRADSEPTSFLDDTFKPNEAFNTARVHVNRYWYLWRKTGSSGTSTTPTIWYKTQRLGVQLYGVNNQAISIKLDTNSLPTMSIVMQGVGTVYSQGTAASTQVDIDWSRGRIYFPAYIFAGGTRFSTEGREVQITYSYTDSSSGATINPPVLTTRVEWQDEQVANDSKSGLVSSTSTAAATDDIQLPIDTSVNESNVCAFLDPMAYADVFAGAYDPLGVINGANAADQPRKVWVYWTSTRNGTPDIYYMAIDPRFTSTTNGRSTP